MHLGGLSKSCVHFSDDGIQVVRGLYLIGEILDCGRRIGGFNFQWAWATGLFAGRAESASVRADGEACH
ncbi:MAG: NAD(P)/FAD-dependent oxidoreductase [Nitrospirota bacterium]|nr:NAD(P)/FAD-dependent oxidoreductase [Nitrospirota bacterium]